MRQLTVGQRLALGFGIVIILSILGIGAGIWAVSRLNAVTDELLQISDANQLLGQSQISLDSEMEAETTYLLSRDETSLNEYRQAVEETNGYFMQFNQYTEADTADLFQDKHIALQEAIDAQLRMVEAGEIQAAINHEMNTTDPLLENLRQLINQEVLEQESLLQEVHDRAESTRRVSVTLLFGLGIGILLGSIAFAVYTTNSITRPAKSLAQAANNLARGDLSVPVESPGKDELAQLANSFESMRIGLAGLIQDLKLAISQAASAATELMAQSQSQAASSTEQAASVTEITASVEELNHTAQSIADMSDRVNQASEQGLIGAQDGQEAALASVDGAENVQQRMKQMTENILALGEQSKQVGSIVALIGEIANETHLLSLNAAIEAAGAGENGKRFAVVAAEVKRLAERTANAANEVREMIAEMQSAVNTSVVAVESVAREAMHAATQAQNTGQSIENMILQVHESANAAHEITLATQQQQSASTQLVTAMHDLSILAEQMAIGSQEASVAAEQLTQIADNLRHSSERFKLSNGSLDF